jgi:hypothetical protein
MASNEWQGVLELARRVDSKALRHVGRNIAFTPETDLVDDLALIGDDALAFMDEFAARFDVSPGDYSFDDYFDSEGLWLLSLKKRKPKLHVTLGMLALAARNGTWDTARLQEAYSQNRYG